MKKFFAVLMAMLMMLCTVQAFADETVPATKTGTFKKLYTGALPVGDKLTFNVTYMGEIATGKDEPDPGLIDATIEHEVKNTGSMENTVTYTYRKPAAYGSYVYKITEANPGIQGDKVTYDTGAIYVVINYLVDNGEVVFDSTVCSAPVSSDSTSQVTADSDKDGKDDQFVNNYAVGTFSISKTITGNASVASDRFVVNVSFVSDCNLENLNISYKTGAATTSTTSTINKLTANTAVSMNVEIGHGETITFEGVPQGVTVTVNETNQKDKGDLNGYVPSYKVGNEDKANIVVGATSQTISITNTKNVTIPTGVYMDYVPYVVLLAAAVIAIAVIAAKRRASNRDDD